MTEIRLQSLAHSYANSPRDPSDYAIREMDHVWDQGGAYALLGPSGCGKSTLLNIISGLLTPSQGEVLFDNKEVNHLPPERRNIAQVFQFPVVYDSMTVFDNLAFPLRNLKYSKSEIDRKVQEIAEVLELDDVLHQSSKNVTADVKQKISMGRGLVRDDVSAILFDEPLTVIDPHLKWKLRRKLKQIHEQFNITMVYVTHDQLEASTFADKIAVMYEGQIVQFGTPQELFETPEHTFVAYFIGSPGMNLIEVALQANSVSFDGLTLPINEEIGLKIREQRSQNIKIGIRPEFVQVISASNKPGETGEGLFAGKLVDVENLGSYKILSFQLGQQKIRARIEDGDSASSLEVGDTGYLRFPAQWLKVYVDEILVRGGQS